MIPQAFVRPALGLVVLAALTACSTPRLVQESEFHPRELGPRDFPGLIRPVFEDPMPLPAAAGPVWLLGIDALSWNVARPLIAAGELPTLARFMAEGAHGVMRSEEPTISPALWATVATGMPRHVHGVVNFVEKSSDGSAAVPTGPLHRQSPALWELVGSAGGESLVVGWFGSDPAERILGTYVTKDFDPTEESEGGLQPEGMLSIIENRERLDVLQEERDLIGANAFLLETLERDAGELATLHALLDDSEPSFVALHLSGIDIVQHLTWRHFEPELDPLPGQTPTDVDLGRVIPAYYRYIDRQLGRLLDRAPADATLIVVSDHGAGPMGAAQAIHLQLGVLLDKVGLRAGTTGELLTISELYRHEKRAWLNLVGIEAGGVVPLDQANERSQTLEARLRAMSVDDGSAVFCEVRNHVLSDSWTPGDAAFTLRFSDAALLTAQVHDGRATVDFTSVRMRHGDVSGGHTLDGAILLRGPAVRQGVLLEAANLYQVAPTVLSLLALPQDARMLAHAPANGGVLEEALKPSWLAEYPLLSVADYEGTDRERYLAMSQAGSPSMSKEELERLRSLGYVQ